MILSPPAHVAATQKIAAQEIIAAVASLCGEAGLKDLAADLVVALSEMITTGAAAPPVSGRLAVRSRRDQDGQPPFGGAVAGDELEPRTRGDRHHGSRFP